jgi:prepilin-type N-terminal cleavage/methylation domain-containing protein
MNQPPPLRLRRGYTLMELLIVVAVLTTVVGLAVPSLRKLSQRGQLQDAARQLRGQLLAARLQAIESASSTLFYYQPDSGAYMVTGAGEMPGGDAGSSTGWQPGLREDSGTGWQPELRGGEADSEQTLPSDVRFLTPATTAARPAAGTAPRSDAGSGWSEPLIFYPNGRALNARIRLASDRYGIEVTVRGLTGTVQLSPVQRLAETADGQPETPP